MICALLFTFCTCTVCISLHTVELPHTTPVLYDILYFVTLSAKLLAIEYLIIRPVLCDILPFTTLLVQNFEVSYVTGSTVCVCISIANCVIKFFGP